MRWVSGSLNATRKAAERGRSLGIYVQLMSFATSWPWNAQTNPCGLTIRLWPLSNFLSRELSLIGAIPRSPTKSLDGSFRPRTEARFNCDYRAGFASRALRRFCADLHHHVWGKKILGALLSQEGGASRTALPCNHITARGSKIALLCRFRVSAPRRSPKRAGV